MTIYINIYTYSTQKTTQLLKKRKEKKKKINYMHHVTRGSRNFPPPLSFLMPQCLY